MKIWDTQTDRQAGRKTDRGKYRDDPHLKIEQVELAVPNLKEFSLGTV